MSLTFKTVFCENLKIFIKNWKYLVITLFASFFFLYVFHGWFFSEYVRYPGIFMLLGLVVAIIFEITLRNGVINLSWYIRMINQEIEHQDSKLSFFLAQLLSLTLVSTLIGLVALQVGFFIGMSISSPATVIFIILAIIFISLIFSSFGLLLAIIIKNFDTQQMVISVMMLAIPVISGAWLYIAILPDLLQNMAIFNPLTYAIIVFRTIGLEVWNLPIYQQFPMELAIEIFNISINPTGALLIFSIFGVICLVVTTLVFIKTDFSKRIKEQW